VKPGMLLHFENGGNELDVCCHGKLQAIHICKNIHGTL